MELVKPGRLPTGKKFVTAFVVVVIVIITIVAVVSAIIGHLMSLFWAADQWDNVQWDSDWYFVPVL